MSRPWERSHTRRPGPASRPHRPTRASSPACRSLSINGTTLTVNSGKGIDPISPDEFKKLRAENARWRAPLPGAWLPGVERDV
ncbi:hypothetical protein ACGFYU_02490 [Streptomyces sp. NPDC048337]|uniref:hypothetical protein n=1 Tax=Streptomyces sp. NPDC048337 TaxID=3365535 RepID=UPI0037127C59